MSIAAERANRTARGARRGATIALATAVTLLAALATPCHAASLALCERPHEPSADQKDVLLRFGAIVRDTLSASGHDVALVSRSGLDLHWLDTRYSHEAVALRDADTGAWPVRELYYSCDEKKPRLYDEGLASFLMGTDDAESGWVSIVLLPTEPSDALRRAAADRRQALGVLGATYSANAYPYSTRFQNCNQWVMELLADAWDDQRDGADDADPAASRARAQRWLYGQGYLPTTFTASVHPILWLAHVVPYLNNDDHPAEELARNTYSVSMPSSVETFVRAKVPGATHVEICHAGRRVVVHHGWDAMPDGCVAAPGDQVTELTRD